MVGVVGSADLAGEVVDADELLGPGLEVLELDLALAQLVADDDREMGPVAGRRLELLAQLPLSELGPRRQAGAPEERRDPQAVRGRRRVGSHDHGDRRRVGDRGMARRLEREERPVETEPEPDRRRGPAAEQLDQPVVAPPSAQRRLPAGGVGRVDLEGRPRVVVEAADEPRIEPE